MAGLFEKMHHDESFLKLKIFSICALVSTFTFFYFMVYIDPTHIDWFFGRVIIAIISSAGLIASFMSTTSYTRRRYYLNTISWCYIIMYFYLLVLNDWSIFHRWSYFVVIAIMATIGLTWRDYIYTAIISLVIPVIFGLFGPLSYLAQVHFHAANFVTFFVIGLTIKSNFKYRDEVVKLTDNLVQNSKMVALGQMSSGMSHEINTPLAIITNSAAQIEIALEDAEKNKATIALSLEKINKAAYRIVRIVQGLYNFSQGDSKEAFNKVDVKEIVSEAYEMYSGKFKASGIDFQCEISEKPALAFCQKSQLVQVVSNLLLNAQDACINYPNPQIKIKLIVENNEIKVSVLDSGPGVPKAIESQIMQPFFTTKAIGQGTGLGLSISLGIARANNGDLYLDRKISPSCFTLKLPATVL